MKKLFAILLTLAMMLSLAACGGEPASTERTEEPEKQEETTKPEAPATDSETIKIGVYMPLTGASAGAGINQVEGIQMAIDEANAAGGINGRMLEMICYDDAGTTEGATKAVTRLIEEDGVQVIAGDHLSSNVLAVSELTEKAKVLQVGTGTGSTWTNIGLNYTYRGVAVGTLPVVTSVEEMVEMGVKSVALISVESEYGQAGRNDVLTNAEKAGIEIKADLTYQSADTDYTGVITKALASGADAVYIYGLGQEVAMVIKQLRQNGYEDVIYTAEGISASEMFTISGSTSNGVVGATSYTVPATPEEGTSELMRDVLKRYYDAYGEMPYGEVLYRGYDQTMLIIEALKNCDNPDSGESIMEAFRQLSGVELLGGTFDFTDGTGDGLTSTNKYMILDGRVQAFDAEALQAWRS